MASNHIMVDIETWGTAPGSAIRSIAAMKFDPVIGVTRMPAFTVAVLDDSHTMAINPKTVEWWNDQPADAKKQFDSPVSLQAALHDFSMWWAEQERDAVPHMFWAKSPSFDAVLLKAAYDHVGRNVPWHYRNERDVRTVYGLVGYDEPPFYGVKHDALSDCRHQISMVTTAYRALGVAD